MKCQIGHMRAFLTVARLGSLTRAAAALRISQPTLTVQLRQMEEALGLQLLDRGRHGAAPTAAGRDLLAECERIVDDFDALIANTRDVAARRAGTVRIAALPSVGASFLPGVLARLYARSPGIRVIVRDAVSHRISAMVMADQVELGLTILPEGPATAGLQTEIMFEDRLVAALPGGHKLTAARSIALSDLASERLIMTDPESSVRMLVDRAFARHGLYVSPVCEVTYMSTAVGLARAGLGIAILPSSAVDLRITPLLETRPIVRPAMPRRIGITHRAGRALSPQATAFVAALRQHGKGRRHDTLHDA